MKKVIFTTTFLVALSLHSKTFELTKPEFDPSAYQDCIHEKSPISSVISESGIENFTYDSFGNLTKDKDKLFSYNDYGQISEITYKNGKKIKLFYDEYGRLTQSGDSSFEYNDFNMMSRLTNPNFQAEYTYDKKTGYRSSKTVNGIQYDFTLDDMGNLVKETDSLGNTSLISWNDSLPETLTYNGITYNFVHNNHGDVIALTDENGEVVNSYEYDIYGKILSESEAIPNPIRYAHEYYDTESGLYYLRGRYYNPETKSFTTADPAEADSKLYAYTGYNPIEFIDPSGYMITKVEKSGHWERAYYISGKDAQAVLKYIAQNLKKRNAKKSLPKPLSFYTSLIESSVGAITGAYQDLIKQFVSEAYSFFSSTDETVNKLINQLIIAADESKNKFAYLSRMNNGMYIPCLISKDDAPDHNLRHNPDDKYVLMNDIDELMDMN